MGCFRGGEGRGWWEGGEVEGYRQEEGGCVAAAD